MAPRTIVVYFSRTERTKQVAEAIAKGLGCDMEAIRDSQDYSGIIGWFRAGKRAMKEIPSKLEPLKADLTSYDLVVVGTPVWAGKISAPVRTFLSENRVRIKDAAFFFTSGGVGNEPKIFPPMGELLGKPPKATLSVRAVEIKKGQHADKVALFVKALQA